MTIHSIEKKAVIYLKSSIYTFSYKDELYCQRLPTFKLLLVFLPMQNKWCNYRTRI